MLRRDASAYALVSEGVNPSAVTGVGHSFQAMTTTATRLGPVAADGGDTRNALPPSPQCPDAARLCVSVCTSASALSLARVSCGFATPLTARPRSTPARSQVQPHSRRRPREARTRRSQPLCASLKGTRCRDRRTVQDCPFTRFSQKGSEAGPGRTRWDVCVGCSVWLPSKQPWLLVQIIMI